MAIQYVSGAVGNPGSPAMPAHTAGDLLIGFAYRNDGANPGTGGWTSLTTGGAGSHFWRIIYKIASSSSEPAPGFTGTTGVLLAVYRDTEGLGSYDVATGGTGVPFTYPALTPSRADGTSVVAGFIVAPVGTAGSQTPPDGMVNRVTGSLGGNGRLSLHDTDGGVTAYAGGTATNGGSQWRLAVVEIKATFTAALTATERSDIGALSFATGIGIDVAYTEAADTVAGVMSLPLRGNVTYSETSDTLTSASSIRVSGAVTYAETADTVTGIIALTRIGQTTYSEATDTVIGLAGLRIAGSATYTEAVETVVSATYMPITATLAATERDDIGALVLSGGIELRVTYTEVEDTVLSAVEATRIAAVAYTEANDTAVGTLRYGIRGGATYTEAADTLSAYITGVVSIEAYLTERDDVGEAELSVADAGYVTYVEADDSLSGSLAKDLAITVIYAEEPDTLTAAYARDNVSSVIYRETADTLAAAATVALAARVIYVEASDTLTTAPVADERECCAPRLCEITPSMLVCNFVNLLPTGPMWDAAKARTMAHYTACAADDAPPPCPTNDDTCTSVVSHSVYTALRLHDLLKNGLWPALRESDPTTAYTTLDDWLARYRWVDCFYGACRDPDIGYLAPYEFKSNCFSYYCEPETPDDLLVAVKHAIVVSLSRLQRGAHARVEDINWVIEPLSARLQAGIGSGNDCSISFDLIPSTEYISSWHLQTCEGVDNPPLQAWFNPTDCHARGLPSRVWPALMAAECIVRAIVPRNRGITINRKGC